ncbi:AhpC/TSA family protein [Ancylomarina salipaludis]|uniref:AhpC/TSA family protein n=1 Tax=Ancylomarina salipaludis TaxID=2501299 RepID=A0A4Q1JJB0_9BACT|nr:TlpA disulfide reductase family protein [Ancylomarina salipaludis]RXQ90976.1 AhpC/TSA family protein [Ancylomarina salipaludis]
MQRKYLRQLVLPFVFICFYSCNKKSPCIEGTISGENWEKIYLYSESRKEPLDSAVVRDDRFKIDTKNLKSQICYIGRDRNTVPLFIVPAPIKASLDITNGKISMEVSGSPEHVMFEEFNKGLRESKELKDLKFCEEKIKKAKQNSNDSLRDQLNKECRSLSDKYWQMVNRKTEQLIEKNQNSPFGLYLFYKRFVYFKNFYTQEKIDEIRHNYKSLGAKALVSLWSEKIEQTLTRFENSVVGRMAPDFSGTDTLGITKRLSDFKGKYVLVDFWASWCYWCRLETPYFKKAIDLFDKDQLAVVGVSFDSKENSWKQAIEEDGSHWNQLLVSQEEMSQIKNAYAFSGIPHIILLDPQGKILARELRGEEIINAVQKHIEN